jgi:hypothetical protein
LLDDGCGEEEGLIHGLPGRKCNAEMMGIHTYASAMERIRLGKSLLHPVWETCTCGLKER